LHSRLSMFLSKAYTDPRGAFAKDPEMA